MATKCCYYGLPSSLFQYMSKCFILGSHAAILIFISARFCAEAMVSSKETDGTGFSYLLLRGLHWYPNETLVWEEGAST